MREANTTFPTRFGERGRGGSNCTDGADLAARHAYLNSIGIPESSIVNLEYFDYARSKYLALGLPDTMPPKGA